MSESYICALFICAVSLPVSIILWLSNMTWSSVYWPQDYEGMSINLSIQENHIFYIQ